MRELQIQRGRASTFFQGMFMVYNILMLMILYLIAYKNDDTHLLEEMIRFAQGVWMPGAVILGMITLVTRKNRITIIEPRE